MKHIQDEIKTVRDLAVQNAKELDATASADPAERMKNLIVQLAAAQARKLEAQNSLAASKDNVKRLNTRLAGMEKQTSDLVSESQRQLRLPKEHETTKRVIYVIARYGRIYTCRNSDLSRNETDIDWTSTSTGEIALPRQGKGIDPISNSAAMGAYFRSQSPASVYIAFCVFEDSFPAFIRAKQLAIERGLSYGWDPDQLSEGPVTFSAFGTSPKPQ